VNADAALEIVQRYLDSSPEDKCTISESCYNLNHDGENKLGWQVYKNKWGYAGNAKDKEYAICGTKPAYLWIGT
jgi:hypothetical protein